MPKLESSWKRVDDLFRRDVRHSLVHARFEMRLDNHERQLLALETGKKKPEHTQ